MGEVVDLPRRGTSKRQLKCGHCKEVGHNKRTCPLLKGEKEKPDPDERFPFEGNGGTPASSDPETAIPGADPAAAYRQDVDEVLAEAMAGAKANAGALDPEEALRLERKVIERWDRWRTAQRKLTNVKKETKQRDQGHEGTFTELMVPAAKRLKHTTVSELAQDREREWDVWRKSISDGAEERKDARNGVAAGWKLVEDAIENSRQLVLPGVDR